MRKVLLTFFVLLSLIIYSPRSVYALTNDSYDPVQIGEWTQDEEVTFAGKFAKRSALFLDWTLDHNNWTEDNKALFAYWRTVSGIVYVMLALFVLVTAFLLIVTRGRSLTISRFLPRFIGIVILLIFSFTIVQFIYTLTDIIQGFFLGYGSTAIKARDLLNIAFPYDKFLGYRRYGPLYDENVFMSLLLVKLTAVTYYVMVGVLLIRKVILWFFLIISPVFPLLLLYAPIRNTAKLWLGEFFRWLLYAPLFAIFLAGLVNFWKAGIPIYLNDTDIAKSIPPDNPTDAQIKSTADFRTFDTSINILLGGPKQTVGLYNSVNRIDTFALYVVSLMMLWVVIILPFVLLRIFLTYFNNMLSNDTSLIRQLISSGYSVMNKPNNGVPPPSQSPPGNTGLGRILPFGNKIAIPKMTTPVEVKSKPADFGQARQIPTGVRASIDTEVLKMANVQIPTMRDIARYETDTMTRDITKHEEVARMHESLEKIAKPEQISNSFERERFTAVHDRLVQEQKSGNQVASGILSASNVVTKGVTTNLKDVLQRIANPQMVASPQERTQFTSLHDTVVTAQKQGDPVAATVLSAANGSISEKEAQEKLQQAKQQGSQLAAAVLSAGGSDTNLPTSNRVQSVSLEDYEAVKKLWQENYQKLDAPAGKADRESWIKGDVEKITRTINLLSSADSMQKKEGQNMVGSILPFLLIGGFSQNEVIAYLKAKLEAAKGVLETMSRQKDEEETKVAVENTTEVKPAEMEAHADLPSETPKQNNG